MKVEICAVCKYPIDVLTSVRLPDGKYAHAGTCYDHYRDLHNKVGMNESNENAEEFNKQLNETQLLID